MRDYRDAKAMARRLRAALAHKGVSLTHTDCLELIARSFGLKDWQVLAAMIDADAGHGASAPGSAPPSPHLWSGPLLPVRDIVMFPKLTAPLFIGRARSMRALASAFTGEQELLLVTQRDRDDDDPGQDQLYPVGIIADVLQRFTLPDGTAKLLVRGRERARLVRIVETDGVRRAEAALTPSPAVDLVASLPFAQAAATAFQAYAKGKEPLEEATQSIAEVVHPGVLADLIAAHAKASIAAKQAVLEMADPIHRLSMAVALIAAPDARAA